MKITKLTAKELVEKCLTRQAGYDMRIIMNSLRGCNEGALKDILDKNRSGYYQFLPCLVDEVKPLQIVELGGAMGAACLMMLNAKYKEFDLWSITLQERGLEFSFISDDYKNLHMVMGDDLDLGNWPRKLDLSQTDIWFYDSEHTKEQLRAELELYSPFHKEGAVILIDDIHQFGLDPVWEDIKAGKYGEMDCYDSNLHWSGYGICIVKKEIYKYKPSIYEDSITSQMQAIGH